MTDVSSPPAREERKLGPDTSGAETSRPTAVLRDGAEVSST
jgi:hypothetical protein